MSGGGSNPTTTQTSTTQLSPEQKQIFSAAFPYASQYASTPLQLYQGPSVAPFTPAQTQAQAGYMTAAPAANAAGTQQAATTAQLADPKFQLDVANNPYLAAANKAMGDVATTNLTQNTLPQLSAQATQASGAYSGASSKDDQAAGLATAQTNKYIADQAAQNLFGAYNQGLQSLTTNTANLSNVPGTLVAGSDIQNATGAAQQTQQQNQIDSLIQQYYTGQSLPLLQSQQLMSLLSGMPGGTTVGTSTGAVPQGPGYIQSGLGGAATGAAIGSVVPVLGTGIGAAVGGGLGLLSAYLNRR